MILGSCDGIFLLFSDILQTKQSIYESILKNNPKLPALYVCISVHNVVL